MYAISLSAIAAVIAAKVVIIVMFNFVTNKFIKSTNSKYIYINGGNQKTNTQNASIFEQ